MRGFRFISWIVVMAVWTLISSAVSAAILTVQDGKLMGATGVAIEGRTYTVRFLDGSCTSLYSGCNSYLDFPIRLTSTVSDEYAATQALKLQVLTDGPKGQFNSMPNLTNGCTDPRWCMVVVPVGLDPMWANEFTSALQMNILNWAGLGISEENTYYNFEPSGSGFASQSTSGVADRTFAVFSANSASIPIIPSTPTALTKGFLTGTIDPNKASTIVITHGWQDGQYGGAPPSWTSEMRQAILNRSPDVNVVIWTWKDAWVPLNPNIAGIIPAIYDAATKAKPAASSQGQMLANALESAGANNVHFIGHSLGTWVNAYAADTLMSNGAVVKQVTLLDRPFNNPDEDRMMSTALDGVQWVDNYYGGALSTGGTLAGAYNKDFGAGTTHLNIHGMYIDTIANTNSKDGFYWSVAGGGFNDPQKSPPAYSGLGSPLTPLVQGLINFLLTPVTNPGFEYGNISTINATVSGSSATMSEGSPAYIWGDWTIPTNVAFFSFEFFWGDRGDGDFLTVHFGDELLFSFLGTDFVGEDFFSSGLIWMGQFAGQTDQLAFTLNNVGDVNADLTLRNLTLSTFADGQVPEPGTLALITLGFAGFAATWRRRPQGWVAGGRGLYPLLKASNPRRLRRVVAAA